MLINECLFLVSIYHFLKPGIDSQEFRNRRLENWLGVVTTLVTIIRNKRCLLASVFINVFCEEKNHIKV